jgi:hypothetical protein
MNIFLVMTDTVTSQIIDISSLIITLCSVYDTYLESV